MAKRKRHPGDPKRAVAYVRVSTDEQSLGPEAQREAITKWCQGHGIEVVAVCEDIGISGGADVEKRPGLLEAMNALVEHDAGVLAVHKRDRLARDVMHAGLIERLAERAGAKVHSADGISNGDSPEAVLQRGIMDLFAMYERLLIRARTKAGLAVKRSRGEYTGGGVPYGWRLSKDAKHLVPDSAEQPVLAAARSLREDGLSLRAIGSELESRGMLPRGGNAWNPKSVRSLLRSPLADEVTDESTMQDTDKCHGETEPQYAGG